jgi:trimethylamine--corrinoid protein Co-methyltransferase
MAGAVATRLAHRLGLPCDTYGLSTSSGVPDFRFAYQRLANALIPALAGADVLSGVGTAASGLVGATEIAVMDDEIIGVLQQITKEVPVDEETLAFDVMKEVIPRDGVFLAEDQTVEQMRAGALWIPAQWTEEPAGSADDTVKAARRRAQALLESHEVEPLAESILAELEAIMAQARRELLDE